MFWDYSLLKKYNSTSHHKLIKQLRNELKITRKQAAKNINSPDINTSNINNNN